MRRLLQIAHGVAPDGTRVVSAENLERTWQPQVPVDANISYGLGWFVDSYKDQPMLHHGGNTLGFTSDLAFLPEAGIGIVVLTNGQGTNLFNEAVRYRFLELVFEQVLKEGAHAGYGNILAATFTASGTTYTAFRYELPGGKAGYYDAEGRSLRRFFLASLGSRLAGRILPSAGSPSEHLLRA